MRPDEADPTHEALKLLPCPLCGGAPKISPPTPNWRASISCDEGMHECTVIADTVAEAAEGWNSRPQPAPTQGEPDFTKLSDDICELLLNEIFFDVEDERNWISTRGRVKLDHLLRSRLGAASRPKVEDAILRATAGLRSSMQAWIDHHNARAEAAEARVAKLEAELAKADAWIETTAGDMRGKGSLETKEYNEVTITARQRHAARQRQKEGE